MPAENPGTWKVVVIFASAALMAVAGILLLVVDPGHTVPRAAPTTPSAAAPSMTQPEPSSASIPVTEDTAASDEEPAPDSIPPKAAETARRFVTAWASHDARPGHDSSFSDAGRRAAAYATAELASQLRDPGDRSMRLWQQWVTDRTRVNCAIDRIATPDGAPSATATRAFVRVLYTCATHAAGRQPTRSHEQLALEMRRIRAGAWRVGALVNA
jgi:hypothetical protein